MKLVTILTALLIASSAHAAARNEVINTTNNINVYGLQCVTRFMPEHTFTRLTGGSRFPIYLGPEVELKHMEATLDGCDFSAVRKIVEDSMASFSHVIDAPIKITKVQSESFVNGNGQCVATLDETVEITLGPTTVMTSRGGKLFGMSDCR